MLDTVFYACLHRAMHTPIPDKQHLGGAEIQIGTGWYRLLNEAVQPAEAGGFARAFVGPLAALRGHGSVGGAVPAPNSLIAAQLSEVDGP